MKDMKTVPWLFVAAWAGLIFFASAQSGDDLHDGAGLLSAIFQLVKGLQADLLGPGVDVISSAAHFLEYAVFGFLLTNALRFHGLGVKLGAADQQAKALRYRAILKRACLLAIVLASLYGITDEFHQSFVPGRFPDPVDWLVDTFGATLGALVFRGFAVRA